MRKKKSEKKAIQIKIDAGIEAPRVKRAYLLFKSFQF
jgi:hypothetical protein